MNKTKPSRGVSDLTALINEKIADWKSIAERSFTELRPFSSPSEFKRSWPRTLNNFLLIETAHTVELLRSLRLEGGDN